MKAEAPAPAERYDVVILGGALSGASTAMLLLRQNPGIRVLILDRAEKLKRRVGEATVEVSAFFLGRVLGLTRYLNEHHIAKQGLRFWFVNDEVESLDQAGEIGARYQVRLPSYQLDRAELDEEVLRRATEAGAEVRRPVTIKDVMLSSGGDQTVTYSTQDGSRTVQARWVVDASGVAAFLARKNGWWRRNEEQPTASAWARWKGTKDWDGLELAEKYPQWANAVHGIRGTATNHIFGDGWWSWWIPLKGGDTSIGVVFDQRLVNWPEEGKLGDKLKNFLLENPIAREILDGAEYDPDDVHWRRNLSYYSTTFAGDGFVLVGDAAGFLDPFYSPGMDWISFTVCSAAELIRKQRDGEAMAAPVEKFNRDFSVCYHRWFSALYKDKYDYLGEFDLMYLAFRMDLSLYYWGVVEPPFREGLKALHAPPFSPPSGKLFGTLMSLYNRRFAAIARRRRKMGELGRRNKGKRCLIPGFTLERKDMFRLFGMLGSWAMLELKEGWKSWGDSARSETGA
ncbi:NAD(P)/FAD-dependent oxidoreductase [Luteolibacter pohnpeiensis]|uniref:NAD(P)/FAD-dependent oxidoreductase n=2 Tax=Luteolibacter pohnpeiensis TaxID=454153 RepID=A0A934S9L4_9BACT|nr:NAD(P)/FAD-dependent oxidoreductase [Luteolibacter pohnpeiensis]